MRRPIKQRKAEGSSSGWPSEETFVEKFMGVLTEQRLASQFLAEDLVHIFIVRDEFLQSFEQPRNPKSWSFISQFRNMSKIEYTQH
ncbi:hypothetical protein VIGAN_06164100 [Vigna angularis var. angularis]|uniref:Uncharacterized protein n=1 Tax=Vigna angularis var. angularis TaxID=157739 RepID=A0A0S3SC13_PHAAN|nr:hypothetical protein VIGAN_06164100 [Vigna angularis var. angularis]